MSQRFSSSVRKILWIRGPTLGISPAPPSNPTGL